VPASEQGIPIIVVLPFEDLTGSEAESNLGKGIAEQFITDLSTFPDFEVVSSTSSFAYAGRPIPDIVKATGARFIVEGSIRRSGDRVSVTVQLINGSTDRHLKTAQIEETMTDPVALQKTVVARIRDELGGMTGVLRKENDKIAFARTDAELTEYDYYILGHVHSLKDEEESARAVWEKGLQRFPQSVLLRYKLMTYYLGFRDAVKPAQELFDQAGTLRKKSRLDEWYFHWLSAMLYSRKEDHNRAVSEARATIAMAPYDALSHNGLSWVLIEAGRNDEAIAWATFAMDHDPYPLPWYPDAVVAAYRGQGPKKYEELIAMAEARIREDPTANRLWYKVLARGYQWTGQSHRAEQALQAYHSLPPAPVE
jgi:TolB-like protein